MSNSLPQVMAVSRIKMGKKILIIFLSFKHSFISPSSIVSRVVLFPLFILFYCYFVFSYKYTFCLLYNPSPSASVLNVKILQWLKRKLRIRGSPIAQSTAFSIPVINLFLSVFSSKKPVWKSSAISQNGKQRTA